MLLRPRLVRTMHPLSPQSKAELLLLRPRAQDRPLSVKFSPCATHPGGDLLQCGQSTRQRPRSYLIFRLSSPRKHKANFLLRNSALNTRASQYSIDCKFFARISACLLLLNVSFVHICVLACPPAARLAVCRRRILHLSAHPFFTLAARL